MNIFSFQIKSLFPKNVFLQSKRVTQRLFSPVTHQRRNFVTLPFNQVERTQMNQQFSKRLLSTAKPLINNPNISMNQLESSSLRNMDIMHSLEERLGQFLEKKASKMDPLHDLPPEEKKIAENLIEEYCEKFTKEMESEQSNMSTTERYKQIIKKLNDSKSEIEERVNQELKNVREDSSSSKKTSSDTTSSAKTTENNTTENIKKENKQSSSKEESTKTTKDQNKQNKSNTTNNNDIKSILNDPNNKQQYIFDVVLLALLGASYMFSPKNDSSQITWHQLTRDLLANHYIDHVTIKDNNTVCVYLKKDIPNDSPYKSVSKNGEPHVYVLSTTSPESFERKFERAQIEMGIAEADFIDVTVRNSLFPKEAIPSLIMNLLLFGLIFYLPYKAMKKMGNGSGGFGGLDGILNVGKAKISEAKNTNVTFKDVAGVDEAKQEVMEFIDFLKNPEKYAKIGAKIPKGALFVGPPGTGKTLLAKATAGEANVPFLSMSGSDFVEMYVGVGASRVRDLFAEARKKSPCIIFIDEIDAVARKRSSGKYGGNDEREATLNQMLVEMDGFKERDGVVVLASTNRLDILDPALLRPGRFDRQISVDPPDIRGRKQIASIYVEKMNIDGDKEKFCEKVAELTPGLTGADIHNILNEACIAAARRNAEKVSFEDLYKGIDRVLGGIEKKNKVISKVEKRRIAIHEAGHALMGWYMTSTDPLLKVTIVPRGPAALGYAQYLPQDIHLYTRSELYEKLCVFMGGRAAEKLEYGEYSIGGADDLEKATKLSYGMITNYGFGKNVGQINFGNENQGYVKPYSETTGTKIDEEAISLIDSAFNDTTKMIQEHKSDLLAIANLLLTNETITYQDIEKLLGKRAGASPQNYQDLIKDSWSLEEEQKLKNKSTESTKEASNSSTPIETTTTNDTKQ